MIALTATRLCARLTPTIASASASDRARARGLAATGAYQSTRKRTHTSSTYSRGKGDGGNSDGAGNPKFSWNQVFLQWALGMYVSTPLIAILQGSLLLNNYRVNYSNAPRPVMPARGVAIAIDEEENASSTTTNRATPAALSSWILHPFSSSPNHHPGPEPPLRLLVVGDSLAAGVGMSKSGVPILPESIARALSKALGGRAVYWTCVGTPGVSAAQIVKDIEQIEPHDPHPKGRQLDRIVKEFQIRRRRWQERREHKDSKDKEIDYENNEKHDRMMDENNPESYRNKSQNVIIQWWKQMRQKESINSEEIRNTTRRVVYEWWMQSNLRNKFRRRKQLVEEDISAIKEIVLKPLPKLDDDDDDYYYDYYRENLLAEDRTRNEKYGVAGVKDDNKNDIHQEQRLPLIHKGSLFRRTSVNPEAAAAYDIAVVLIGLNDVKDAFMPHMNSGSPDTKRLESSLRQVLEALRDKMGGNMNLEGNRDKNNCDDQSRNMVATSNPDHSARESSKVQESSRHPKPIRHPLVVVPELPVAPLQVFRLVPLCWFLVPIFRAMENNKRFLASCFPDNVVFVDQPDICWWTDTEMGIGSIRENIQKEQLLLRVTDSVRSPRERIEQLMKNYYDSKEEETESQSNKSKSNQHQYYPDSSSIKNENDIYAIKGDNRNGSDLVSIDRMHPNDEGYELWGRHIAAAIIEHWNKNSNNNH